MIQEVLDRHGLRTADVITAYYVGPEGDTGFDRVQLKPGGPVHFASSLFPGSTFRPGTQVTVLRPYGGKNLVVAGRPPVGKRGVAAPVRTIHRAETAASPDYLAWAYASSILYAYEMDAAGATTTERDSQVVAIGGSLPLAAAVLIRTDSSGTVGANSVAWVNGGVIYVHDPGAATVYSHTPTDQVSPPAYADGWLYWVENPDSATAGETAFTLRRSRADLASPETVTTRAVTVVTSVPEWDESPVLLWHAGSTVYVARHWTDPDEASDHVISFSLDGATTADDEYVSGSGLSGLPPVSVPAGAVAVGGASGGTLQTQTASPTPDFADLWPAATAYEVDSTRSSGVSSDGLQGVLYGSRGFIGATYHVIRSPLADPPDDPATTFEVPAHATAGVAPTFVFSKG